MVVDLGFVEKAEGHALNPLFFPSKVGGKPLWLNCKSIPSADQLRCGVCGKVLMFLLQVYAPAENDDRGYHRTMFLFCCKDGKCYFHGSNKCFRVFRTQLRKVNAFYSSEPLSDDITDEALTELTESFRVKWLRDICEFCGCAATKKCSACQITKYCSKEHQAMDWRGSHKKVCRDIAAKKVTDSASEFVLNEFELVTAPEPESKNKNINLSEQDEMKVYDQYLRAKGDQISCQDISAKEIQKFINQSDGKNADKHFQKFKRQIAIEPDQVIRYSLNSEPLWVSGEGLPLETDIPSCTCGAPRQFEFQVLPQLLYYLKVDKLQDKSIDWGTLAIYTCIANCDEDSTYHEEFVWKQDFSAENLTGLSLSGE